MSASQIVRTAPISQGNNPSHISNDIVALTNQLFGSGAPASSLGVVGNVYTDVSTGFQYQMHDLGWSPTIALGSFAPAGPTGSTGATGAIGPTGATGATGAAAVVPDPLSVHQLNVDTIQGNTGESLQVNLGAAGTFNVGPSGAEGQVSFGSDGSLTLDVSTAAIVLADGLGNQTTYEPQQAVATNNLTIIGNNALALNTNVAGININSATNLILNPVGTTQVTSQILSSGNNPNYADAAGTSGLSVAADLVKLRCATGGDVLTVQPAAVTVAQPILIPDGTAGAPSITLSSDTTSGIHGSVGNVMICVAGGDVLTISSSSATFNNSGLITNGNIIPLSDGVFNLGAPSFQWNNIYAVNPLIVSDENKKKNINNMPDKFGLDFLYQLRPVTYQMKKDKDDAPLSLGLIAQEVDKVLLKMGDNYDIVRKEEGNQFLIYNALIPCLIKGVNELNWQIELLKDRLNDLEKK